MSPGGSWTPVALASVEPARGAAMLIGTVAILMGVFLLAVVALALARLRRRRGEHRASKTGASDAWSEAGRRAETHPWDRPPP